jgi:hypothetical protein
MNYLKRIKTKTPKFFRVLRNFGVILLTVGGVLVASEYELPQMISRLGEYLIVAGSVVTAVAQSVVEGNEK